MAGVLFAPAGPSNRGDRHIVNPEPLNVANQLGIIKGINSETKKQAFRQFDLLLQWVANLPIK